MVFLGILLVLVGILSTGYGIGTTLGLLDHLKFKTTKYRWAIYGGTFLYFIGEGIVVAHKLAIAKGGTP